MTLFFEVLRYLTLIVMWIQPIFSFMQPVTCNLKAFIFSKTVAFQKGILKNKTKFTGKHLCRNMFFNKVARLSPATLFKKRGTGIGLFLSILWNIDLNFKSTSGGSFCIVKISRPVTQFTSSVKIIVFKISVKYFLLIKSGNLWKVFPSWIRFL